MKEMAGEQTMEKVINFIKETMKIHVLVDDVQTAQIIGLKKDDSPYPWAILIKFNNHWTKRAAYKDRRQLKELKGEKIFFNEDLTNENASLFYEDRKLNKSGAVVSAFKVGGIVIVITQRNSEPVKITKRTTLAYLTDQDDSFINLTTSTERSQSSTTIASPDASRMNIMSTQSSEQIVKSEQQQESSSS